MTENNLTENHVRRYPNEDSGFFHNQAQAMYKRKMRLMQSAEIVEYMKSRKISPEELAQRISCNVREILQATKGGIQSKETDKKLKAFFKKTA